MLVNGLKGFGRVLSSLPRDVPGFIDKEADAADALAEAYHQDFVAVLLGPAEPPCLDWRVHAQKELTGHGYKAFVMETYPPGPKGELLAQKWERMLQIEKPTHFFIVVPMDAPLRGAHIEFGYLMREYGVREILDRVRFFLQDGTDAGKALAGYEAELGRAAASEPASTAADPSRTASTATRTRGKCRPAWRRSPSAGELPASHAFGQPP